MRKALGYQTESLEPSPSTPHPYKTLVQTDKIVRNKI